MCIWLLGLFNHKRSSFLSFSIRRKEKEALDFSAEAGKNTKLDMFQDLFESLYIPCYEGLLEYKLGFLKQT